MKKNIYAILVGLITITCKPLPVDSNILNNTVAKHASGPINIYVNSKDVAKIGFGICDFLCNGEKLVIETFIKKNDTVFDVGAHIGGWTRTVLAATQCQCYLYVFEPIHETYKSLEKVKNLCRDRVSTFNLALGKEEKQTEMHYLFQKGSDCSTLFDRPDLRNVPARKVKVAMTTLDNFMCKHEIAHINFLKIDTEGTEWDILKGAHNAIISNAIDIIQFEYGVTSFDAHVRLFDLYNYLTSSEYLIFRIIPDGLIYIPEWDESLENFTYSNYLALKKAN